MTDERIPVKCELCENELFKLSLTENLNLRVTCACCKKSFVLELDNSAKQIRRVWENGEFEDNEEV